VIRTRFKLIFKEKIDEFNKPPRSGLVQCGVELCSKFVPAAGGDNANVKALETAAHQNVKFKKYLMRASKKSDSHGAFPVALNILLAGIILYFLKSYISNFEIICFFIDFSLSVIKLSKSSFFRWANASSFIRCSLRIDLTSLI